MGCRRRSRAVMNLSVSLCGTDSRGRAFIERVSTSNISRDGALLEGVRCLLKPGDVVVLRCEENTGRFRVIWAHACDGVDGRRLGLARLGPPPRTEDSALPISEPDEYQRPRVLSRRAYPRYACEVAAEIRLKDAPTPMWVTSATLSEGGCSVDTQLAVPSPTELNIALWLGEEKIWVQGVVVSSLYGVGTGIKFTSVSRQGREQLKDFLAQRTQLAADRRLQSGSGSQPNLIRNRDSRDRETEAEFTVSSLLTLPENTYVL
jgi:hypothetical protein